MNNCIDHLSLGFARLTTSTTREMYVSLTHSNISIWRPQPLDKELRSFNGAFKGIQGVSYVVNKLNIFIRATKVMSYIYWCIRCGGEKCPRNKIF